MVGFRNKEPGRLIRLTVGAGGRSDRGQFAARVIRGCRKPIRCHSPVGDYDAPVIRTDGDCVWKVSSFILGNNLFRSGVDDSNAIVSVTGYEQIPPVGSQRTAGRKCDFSSKTKNRPFRVAGRARYGIEVE